VAPASSTKSISAATGVLTGLRGLALAVVLALGGCGTLIGKAHGSYPNLRDMPSLPQNVSSESEREKILKQLEQDQDQDQSEPAKSPAVPPLPARSSAAGQTNICSSDTQQVAANVPTLRGTLHGSWQPAAPAASPQPSAPPPPRQVAQPARQAPIQGQGITASIVAPAPARPGVLVIGFGPGAAELTPEQRGQLYNAAARFILDGGDRVTIQSRGGKPGPTDHLPPQPLESLSLGLRRASAIADVLVADGVSADRIHVSVLGDRDVPQLLMADWSAAGADGAVVTFAQPGS
jgi:outer membrane protein OmpA-like peptidoglycan-associated protein